MYTISVFFHNGEWASVQSKYAFSDNYAELLNKAGQESFVNIAGIICKPKDVETVIVKEIPEDDKDADKQD